MLGAAIRILGKLPRKAHYWRLPRSKKETS